MTINRDQLEYLKSERSDNDHDAALSNYFKRLERWRIGQEGFLVVDVNIYRDLVMPGILTYITEGLSGFLLHDIESGTINRSELAISVPSEPNAMGIPVLLNELCNYSLDRSSPPSAAGVIFTGLFKEKLGDKCNLEGLYCYYGAFIPMEFRSFSSGVELDVENNILELIPVTAWEIELIKSDAEKFMMETSQGDIDLFDLFRK